MISYFFENSLNFSLQTLTNCRLVIITLTYIALYQSINKLTINCICSPIRLDDANDSFFFCNYDIRIASRNNIIQIHEKLTILSIETVFIYTTPYTHETERYCNKLILKKRRYTNTK